MSDPFLPREMTSQLEEPYLRETLERVHESWEEADVKLGMQLLKDRLKNIPADQPERAILLTELLLDLETMLHAIENP